MLSPNERILFESLARNTRFRDWVVAQKDKQYGILVSGVEELQIRRAQGAALMLQQIIDNLDASLTSR
jgi:hypothetical protein